MNFFQQLRDALRGQIEDFFRVKPPAVLLMLGVIAVLISYAVLRINFYPRELFWVQIPLLLVVMLLLRAARRFF